MLVWPSLKALSIVVKLSGEPQIPYCCFFKHIFVRPGSIFGPLITPYFGLHVTPPIGFKARVVLSPVDTLACLHVMILRVTSGATPAFSTCWSVRCKSM